MWYTTRNMCTAAERRRGDVRGGGGRGAARGRAAGVHGAGRVAGARRPARTLLCLLQKCYTYH